MTKCKTSFHRLADDIERRKLTGPAFYREWVRMWSDQSIEPCGQLLRDTREIFLACESPEELVVLIRRCADVLWRKDRQLARLNGKSRNRRR